MVRAHHPTCAKEIYFPGEGSCNQATGILHVSWHTHSEREEGREREKGKENRVYVYSWMLWNLLSVLERKCLSHSAPEWKHLTPGEIRKLLFFSLSMGAHDYIKLSIHWNGNAFPIRKYVSHWKSSSGNIHGRFERDELTCKSEKFCFVLLCSNYTMDTSLMVERGTMVNEIHILYK